MESRFHGVPILATKAAASYKGIRAPLTVDESDFEYSFSSKSHRNSTTSSYYSGSELDSEGFESGEDELGTESERPHVVEKDEENLEETHFVKEFTLSEPSVRNPDEEFGQQSGNVSGSAVSRPFARIPNGRMYKGSSNVDDSDDSGSFLSDSGDEIIKDESYIVHYGDSRSLVAVKDEEVSENGPSLLVDTRIPLVQKLHIPIAQLSADTDSDEDSQGSGVSSEEGFPRVVRIPSIEVLRRFNSPLKVRISESDEGDDNESRGEFDEGDDDESRGEFDEDLMVSSLVLGPSDEERFDVESSVQCDVLADMDRDKGPDIDKEAMTNSLVVNEEVDSMLELGQNGDAMLLQEEIQEIGVTGEQKCVELVDNEEIHSTLDVVLNGDAMHSVEVIQEIDVIDEQKKCIELVEHTESSDFSEDVIFPENVSGHCNQSESVEIESELEISSIHRYVDIKEVFTDSLSEDASSTAVIVSSRSVYGDSVLGKKSRREDESRDRFSGEVEEPTFHSESKIVVAEMNRVLDSTSFSNREILLDHSQEIDCQIVTGFHEEVDADGGINKYRPITEARHTDNFMAPLANGESEKALSERDKNKIEKIQQIRVKYLHLLQKLGRSPEDSVASKVLNQLKLAEKSSSSQAFLEAPEKDDLVFSLSILVIGKTGVGKSATINSIFGEKKAVIDAFEPSTTHVREIIGTMDGVKLNVFDTPGLRSSFIDQSINRKILLSIKKLMQKCPPDIILYVDRLDTQTGLNDSTLLKSLTSYLGSSIWRKTIIAFTHGNSIPPDGPSGYPSSYEAFVSQQSWIIQQLIGQSVVSVCVVENHPHAEKNVHGETLLCNGERWRSHLLLLCWSMKILSEFSSTITIHSPLNHRKNPSALSYSLSSLLQSNVHPKLSNDQSGENFVSDKQTVPPSKNGENTCFRYLFLEPFSRILTRPVFDSPWDHDDENEISDGLSIVYVGENVVKGLRDRDRLAVGKQLILVENAAFVLFSGGRNSRFNINVALNNNRSGKISIKTRCSDHLQIAALAFVPIVSAVFKKIFGYSTED